MKVEIESDYPAWRNIRCHRPVVEPDSTSGDFCTVILEDGRRYRKSIVQGSLAEGHVGWHGRRDETDIELQRILRLAQSFLMATHRSKDGNMKDLKQFIDSDSSDLAADCRVRMGEFANAAERTWQTYLSMDEDIKGGSHSK
jgi:hypothetical protein